MSVVWRPPRKLLPVLVLFLCLVSALVLVAQQDESSAAAVQPGMTEITASVLEDSSNAVSSDTQNAVAPDNNVVQDPVVAPAADDAVLQETESAQEAEVAADAVPAIDAQSTVNPVPEITETPAAVPVVEPVKSEAASPAVAVPPVVAAEPVAATAVAVAAAPATAPVVPEELIYFDMKRLNVLVIILCLVVLVSYYTFHAQRGREMFIRRISGLSALEDAVGRATEMGRGVLYIPGIMDMEDIQTIAGVTILGHVAKKTAEYDTPLFAPMTRSFVMSVAQEIVKQSYLEKGRPDAYRPDRINYLTDDQFGFVAGVGGIMMREKPAACFYLGTFYAESLILAETGNAVGAIQIAGTAEPSQIPFFVAACDYTLIGEELFAASAYLSKNPKEVGSLKGQDMVKLIIIILIVVGTALVTIAKTDFAAGTAFVTLADNFMRLLN